MRHRYAGVASWSEQGGAGGSITPTAESIAIQLAYAAPAKHA
jgi:hypothetical protein